MLWVDNHRPKTLDALDVHPDITKRLGALAETKDFPHLLFYGPPGAGKKTRVMALLRAHYGAGAGKVRLEQRSVQATQSKTVDVTVIASSYHIEVNPSDVGIYDRAVVMHLIKEMAESAPLMDASGKRQFKVIVISEVDRLTKVAQQALRRTMEKYMTTCRLILVASSLSRIMPPLRSRCLAMRIPLPDQRTMQRVLCDVASKEAKVLPEQLAANIAKESGGNMRKAILCLESTSVQTPSLDPSAKPMQPEYARFIAEIAIEIIQEQSPKRVWEVRAKLYELLTNCIPPDFLIRRLAEELIKNVGSDGGLQIDVAACAAHFEHAMRVGSRPIVHLEAFVCQFMAIYRRHLANLARATARP